MQASGASERERNVSPEGLAQAEGKREFLGVQALRAVAALMVVAGHGTDFLQVQNGWVPNGFRWFHGPAGVDVFFVISGFVITISTQRLLESRQPARLFLWRRLMRIVPLYWMLTTVRLVIVEAMPSLSIEGRPGVWNAVASYLFIPAYNRAGVTSPIIPMGWTLNFEMLFYAVFAAALLVRDRYLRLLLPVLMTIGVVGIFRPYSGPGWTLLANPIVFEFLAGVALALIAMRFALPPAWMAWPCVVLGFAGMSVFPDPSLPVERVATWGVSAFLVVMGVVALEPLLARRLPHWALVLGDASYSIYLVQTFVFGVIHLGARSVRPALVQQRPVSAGLLMMAVGLVGSSAVGVATYRWVERPMTRFLRRKAGAQQPAPVAGA